MRVTSIAESKLAYDRWEGNAIEFEYLYTSKHLSDWLTE